MRFPDTHVESDENIANSEKVVWNKITSDIDFNDYVTCADGLSICTIEVDEIVNLLEPLNSNSDAEIDKEILIVTFISCFTWFGK